jgi:hypothetical protein
MKLTFALLALALHGTAFAASANAVVDAGGRRATSAHCAVDGSLGTWGGVASAPGIATRPGFAGQLYDVQGFGIGASPATVNEGGTRQLTARAILDDGSALVLPATNVSWSPLSGPIASITTGGLVTGSTVFQDTLVSVRGTYLSRSSTLSLTVLNTVADNYGAYAGDGVEDAWQVQYFGVGNAAAGPAADPDGDGQNNQFEYGAGTVPTNAASRFRLSLGSDPGSAGSMRLTFGPCLTNRTYAVQSSTTLTPGSFATRLVLTPTSNTAESVLTDTHPAAAARFYRMEIRLTP